MKIEFRKIVASPKQFTLDLSDKNYNVKVVGSFYKLANGLVKIDSIISGNINLICDLSGEEFTKNLNENVVLFAKDGIFENQINDENFDVIEFFDGYMDLSFIFKSELESINLEYHTKE
ncbi:hypothetical protein CCY99_02750 [Helicobacter sp. 16-1353]|uniref:hypothetical protein n=1 Tax=Helicobacter sp. 16-1353 TaxID=2004996 RepID=UPI000DCBC99E|nr:hypothetical protein [Helicobacter sp. 16-1353]RAX54699.1 hypothetical protein CCY99_02750 [Helicobacter sp. 16-1353]